MMRNLGLTVLAILAACTPDHESTREQADRLRSSIEKYRQEYVQGIERENRLIQDTLQWLSGTAVAAPRSRAAAEARVLMDRWAAVYFGPRYMHERLRFDRYSSAEVRTVQSKLLAHLKRRYFELHDYQRYAQRAGESEMHRTPAGRLPRQLEEFRARLEVRRPAVDEIGPLLAALPD